MILVISTYRCVDASPWPEMISGVRASSTRMRVDLVDDRVVQRALHAVVERVLHVVAQVVEAELVVLPVRDVRAVRA